jgi:hypothetical protein
VEREKAEIEREKSRVDRETKEGRVTVTGTERGPLSATLSLLFILLTAQFFVGMALNLLTVLPTNVFPPGGGSFIDAMIYSVTSENLLLTAEFVLSIIIILVALANIVFAIQKNIMYSVLSFIGIIAVLAAFVNGVRFVGSNFTDGTISYWMAGAFLVAYIAYFMIAILMYRDIAIQNSKA